jgi:hypothetical protein
LIITTLVGNPWESVVETVAVVATEPDVVVIVLNTSVGIGILTTTILVGLLLTSIVDIV